MGLILRGGLQSSITAGGFTPQASVGTAAGASPQGPATIGQQAYGIVAGDTEGSPVPFYAAVGGGALSLGLLVFIWWSLPR